jgi:hypothetical protein
MQRMCKKKTNNHGCILLHLSHIDQEHVVVDELQLLMGITDVLLRIVIEDAVRLDQQKVGSNRSNSAKEEFQDSKGLI